MVANLNVFIAHPIFDSLAHVGLKPRLIIFFFCHFDKYECMEKAGVQPEYMLKNDIQRTRHPKFENWCTQEQLSASD